MSAGRKNTSEKKDWNTPPKLVEAIRTFYDGRIGLDPCSNEYSTVSAIREFSLPETDGLMEKWLDNTVFVNPPYGRNGNGTSLYSWVSKAWDSCQKYSNEIIMLIPVATNTKHFKDIIFEYAKAICFLKDTRLRFWNEGVEDKKGAPMACCLVYFGNMDDEFLTHFSDFGKTLRIDNPSV